MTKDELKTFIQNTLGCDCPEDVLADISSEVHLSGGPLYDALLTIETDAALLSDRIISVGGRLLVIVTRVGEEKKVRMIMSAGVKMRDRLEYNRFRLAVMTTEPGNITHGSLMEPFDDRVHLHLLET